MRHGRRLAVFFAAAVLASQGCGGSDEGGPAGPLAASPAVTPAPRPTTKTDPVFNPDLLHDVRLVMDLQQWQALRDNFRENQYYAADVTLDGERLQQVGIR